MKKVLATSLVVILNFGVFPAHGATTLPPSKIVQYFEQAALSPSLANPAMIVIDRSTGEVVFEKDSTSPRKPASVMKVFAATATLEFLDPETRYATHLFSGSKSANLVLVGSHDPWLTATYKDSVSNKRAWIGNLVKKAIPVLKNSQGKAFQSVVIHYTGIFTKDADLIKSAFKDAGFKATLTPISPGDVAANSKEEIATVISPTVREMVEFAILWSDNNLANRMVLNAASVAGYGMSPLGVSLTIHDAAARLGVNTTGLEIFDGSGLSKEDRVTAKVVADLLQTIRDNPKFLPIYEGLPISGVSGTLEKRYLTTAPQAVGLVHAKTGTLDGTVSLAGYVDSADRQYIVVAIADRIRVGWTPTNNARTVIDKLFGKLAAPLSAPVVEPTSETSPSPTI